MSGHSKRCVLLVVDALSVEIVKSFIDMQRLPNLARLVAEGGALRGCHSIFPSITPAATCSIITGAYPAEHGIEGAFWFDRSNQDIAYFGDDLSVAREQGLYDYLVDFGDRLNFDRLAAPTLFRLLDDQGIDAACVNYMWFAGPHQHQRVTPLALRLGVGTLPETVQGPKYLKLGSFVESLPEGVPKQADPSILNRYGFSDQVTADCLLDLARADALPEMTVGYFPENDDLGHVEGLVDAADTALTRFDAFLGEFIEILGGWETLGKTLDLVIVGDHSQVEFGDNGPRVLQVDEALEAFQQATVGKGWQDDDQIFICPNMRAAAIYPRDVDDASLRQRIVQTLVSLDEVDQVIHQDDDGTLQIETSDRGRLAFRPATADDDVCGVDAFGNRWWFQGELETVGCSLNESGELVDQEYPNPLERLRGGFHPGARPIWITARTDSEFGIQGVHTHAGGSHGSLHAVDTQAAVLVSSGIDLSVLANPDRPRIVDIVTLCQNALGDRSPSSADVRRPAAAG
ncbi:alkaline phosphatase family protein [Roseiconus nitratireducens]|uniref:Alkaline phosphatase family protein n=1 Tax=Roseiconus nitratireducens TaxID=2605748 RepID=A0A5M6CVK5_9BACT|nr:alkaline phosphatase family protein [Roseiconus nitratireducens]KAA5539083.1 alkaline phosphatase family protein [Roseiconus nitratireducens]